jgi:hypothetical protein
LVKTRLVPPLTPARAARLHGAFIRDTLRRVATVRCARYLACAPTANDPFLLACARRYQTTPISQGPGTLGTRMARVVRALLARHRTVLVIGTDSPTFPIRYVARARALLASADLVFGPSEDGGYYLLGQRRVEPRVFRGIPWGSGEVLAATLARLDPRHVALLPRWYDVDRPADLERLRRELTRSVACPHTRAVFRAWDRGPRIPHRP